MTTPIPFTPRLPPVARGACRAPHAAPPPLPESPPAPAEDAPVQEVLADQAEALARAVEETDPALMQAARDAARVRAMEEAIAGASETYNRPRTLTHWGYGPEPTNEAEWEARAERERHPSRG